MEFFDADDQVYVNYNLIGPHKIHYMHNILTKYKEIFYLDRVKSYAITFYQAVRMIHE